MKRPDPNQKLSEKDRIGIFGNDLQYRSYIFALKAEAAIMAITMIICVFSFIYIIPLEKERIVLVGVIPLFLLGGVLFILTIKQINKAKILREMYKNGKIKLPKSR